MKPSASTGSQRAFSLLEVMIAIGIFFIGSFTILMLVSSALGNARRLERPLVDASPVLATFAATNKLVEAVYHGNLGDETMLGKAYRDYDWTAEVVEIASNKLFSVECVVQLANGNRAVISDMTTVLYRPESPAGSMDGGFGMKGK